MNLEVMKQKLLNICMLIVLVLSPAGLWMASAAADCSGGSNGSAAQVLQGISQNGHNCDATGVNNAVSAVVNILSLIIGIAAIIMILISGFRYITSGGATERVGNAKNTLLYAIIGLIIVALAQFIVHFVLNRANGAVPCPTNTSISSNDSKCKS
jgi:Type IV secretion system pilin